MVHSTSSLSLLITYIILSLYTYLLTLTLNPVAGEMRLHCEIPINIHSSFVLMDLPFSVLFFLLRDTVIVLHVVISVSNNINDLSVLGVLSDCCLHNVSRHMHTQNT